MSPTCPTCGKPIDPLRAPVARISGGKIVTYCSKQCAEPDVAKLALAAAAASDKLTASKPPAKVERAPAPKPEVAKSALAVATARVEVPPARPPTPPTIDLDPDHEERPKSEADRRRRRNRR